MKKTISISIQGFHFIIEEDAYAKLSEYLIKLENILANAQGKTEIIEDIELRIAELCQQNRTDKQEVINIHHIESILATLGNPDDYLDSDTIESTQTNSFNQTATNRSEKRLFRDTENSVLAGVCSGIAAYFGIDVVIIRAVYVAIFLTVGFGFPLYFILWIIVPKAVTSIDKLRMHGKPVTVESVKQEVEDAASRIKQNTKKWYQRANSNTSTTQKLRRIAGIFLKVLGWFLLIIGLIFFIPVVILLFNFKLTIPVELNGQNIELHEFSTLIFEQGRDAYFVYAATIMLLLAIMNFFLLSGSSLIWQVKRIIKRTIGIVSLVLFFSSIVLFILVGLNTAPEFEREIHQERKAHSFTGDSLFIETTGVDTNINDEKSIQETDANHITLTKHNILVHGIEINFEKSADTSFHVVHKITATGRSSKDAFKRMEHINYSSTLKSNKLSIPSYYSFPKKDKFRGQDFKLIIQIPDGKIIFINGQQLAINEIKKIHIAEEYLLGGNIEPSGQFIGW